MENKCEEIINSYLMLDKGEAVPLSLTIHILFCPKCRREIKLLKEAERLASRPIYYEAPVTDQSILTIIKKIDEKVYLKLVSKPISLTKWILYGIIMICLLFGPVLNVCNLNNRTLAIAYAFLIGFGVTIYSGVFIISNIDYFIKKISSSSVNASLL